VAKHAVRKKPKRRKEQPWLAAARSHLYRPIFVDSIDYGLPKLSEALYVLAEPWIDALPDDCTVEEVHGIVQLAHLAWNYGIPSSPDHDPETDAMIDEMPPGVREVFDEMVEVRRTDFADDPRLIVDALVYKDGDEFRIRAAGVFPQ
jgi:hypothetical protein